MVVDKFWFYNKTHVLGINKTGAFRCKFLKESLLDLRANLNAFNSELIIRYGSSAKIIPAIIKQYGVNSIYYHDEIHEEEQRIVKQVIKNSKNATNNRIQFKSFWGGNTMYNPEDLPFKSIKKVPDTFTSFRKVVEKHAIMQKPVDSLTKFVCKPHPKFDDIGKCTSLKQFGCSVHDVKIDKRTAFPFSGGETEGLDRMMSYIWGANKRNRGPIVTYKKTRNQMIGSEFSTKFSPFLAHGNLSARYIAQEITKFENTTGISNESTYWVYFELLWRDYWKFASMKHGNSIFDINGPYGRSVYKPFAEKNWQWSEDRQLFDKWCNGETGYPFVDAAMIELKLPGFMSNRLRQNVASFLVKELGIDWRWGAEWFESLLLDYDVASNYCNWCYIVGNGFDPMGHSRYFNINKQASSYDKNGEFVKLWLPELSGVKREFIHKPYAMNAHQQQIANCVLGKDYYLPCAPLNPPAKFGKKTK